MVENGEGRTDSAPSALFSTIASDNAEVVPPTAPRGPESMWSTDATAPADESVLDDSIVDEQGDEDGPTPDWAWSDGSGVTAPPPWSTRAPDPSADTAPEPGADTAPGAGADPAADAAPGPDSETRARSAPRPGPDPAGPPPRDDFGHVIPAGPFSAEPTPRDDDVVEAGDLYEPEFVEQTIRAEGFRLDSRRPPDSPPVFSSGPPPVNGAFDTRANRPASPPLGRPAPGPSEPDPVDPWTTLGPDWAQTDTPAAPTQPEPAHAAPAHAAPTHAAPTHAAPAQDEPSPRAYERVSAQIDDVVPDPHGLEAAVSRLRPEDQSRAVVPIAVCGALLEEGEYVIGAVTGQMLGRPAAVVVTEERVLVANDRRWQPIVDVYQIDSKLVVRGRHDRQIAALSFADDARLSMVDGITEVALAIELADRIRDAGPVEPAGTDG